MLLIRVNIIFCHVCYHNILRNRIRLLLFRYAQVVNVIIIIILCTNQRIKTVLNEKTFEKYMCVTVNALCKKHCFRIALYIFSRFSVQFK